MSWSRRLRNIALTQVKAIKERLDSIDAEADADLVARRREREDALRELRDGIEQEGRPRTPEEIAGGAGPRVDSSPTPQTATPSALARYYKVLGVQEGADLGEVEEAYRRLASRCRAVNFENGSEEQQSANEIMERVDEAYNALREALNPAAGRFDKLEL